MSFKLTREDFLERAVITEEKWKKSGMDWSVLFSIAKHHDASIPALASIGGAIANRIQAFNGVHSVRWRVKDTFGLLKKIVRKNTEEEVKEKWKTINVENYRSVVSDLIGVRALHLLREECVEIDEQLRKIYDVYDVTIFKREGDPALTEIIEQNATEKPHTAGYRSIHYDYNYTAEKDPVFVEIQVRTIFQEGWSEIDHKVRYPDFSKNELLKYFIGVFNGLSGTADDMGSFVIMLHKLIETTSAEILKGEVAIAARDSDIEQLQKDINQLRENGKAPKETIDSIQSTFNNIKEKNTEKSKQDLLSKTLFSITSSGFLTPDMAKLGLMTNMLSSESSLMKAMEGISRPSAIMAKAMEQIARPDMGYASAMDSVFEDVNRSNAQLAARMAALTEATNPLSAAAAAMVTEINESNAVLSKASETLRSQNAGTTKAAVIPKLPTSKTTRTSRKRAKSVIDEDNEGSLENLNHSKNGDSDAED